MAFIYCYPFIHSFNRQAKNIQHRDIAPSKNNPLYPSSSLNLIIVTAQQSSPLLLLSRRIALAAHALKLARALVSGLTRDRTRAA